MRSVISIGGQLLDRLCVATQLIGYDDTRLAVLRDEPCEKPACGFLVSPGLHQNIQNIAISINGSPKPVLLAVNRDAICHWALADHA